MKAELNSLMRIISSSISSLSEDELNALLTGKGELLFTVLLKDHGRQQIGQADIVIRSIIDRLNAATTRDEANLILKDQPLTKSDLQTLARQLNIITKESDKKEILIERIIEATVGSRLRTKAIKGEG